MATPTMPTDPEFLAAFGRVAIAHGQLEAVQRYLVRTLADLEMKAALDSTEGWRIADVRTRVRKLAKERNFPESILCRIDALLNTAGTLARERNELLHRIVQTDAAGNFVQLGSDQTWSPAPTVPDLDSLAAKIERHAFEINRERLRGFIRQACNDYPLVIGTGRATP